MEILTDIYLLFMLTKKLAAEQFIFLSSHSPHFSLPPAPIGFGFHGSGVLILNTSRGRTFGLSVDVSGQGLISLTDHRPWYLRRPRHGRSEVNGLLSEVCPQQRKFYCLSLLRGMRAFIVACFSRTHLEVSTKTPSIFSESVFSHIWDSFITQRVKMFFMLI